jgi:hypothetical protein
MIFLPELVVLVDFVFPWGIEYPVVFLPCGVCKWPSFKEFCQMARFPLFTDFSQTVTFRGFYIYNRLLIRMSVIKHTV